MTDEYNALVNGTKVVKPVDEKDLDSIPGIENAEFAPGKLVTTIKAPLGRKRARAVTCGHLLTDGKGESSKSAVKARSLRWTRRKTTREASTAQPRDASYGKLRMSGGTWQR